MDWKLEALMAGRAVLAALLGGFIGWDRERQGQEAGVRTFAAVALGACVFGLVSSHLPPPADPGHIAAQVVTGIGFLGAGVILFQRGQVTGLTTAATIWAAASVGLAIAFGMYVLGVLAAVIIYILLAVQRLPGWAHLKGDGKRK